jgi:hypothetical protein
MALSVSVLGIALPLLACRSTLGNDVAVGDEADVQSAGEGQHFIVEEVAALALRGHPFAKRLPQRHAVGEELAALSR